MEDLKVNSYRFSISWARVLPSMLFNFIILYLEIRSFLKSIFYIDFETFLQKADLEKSILVASTTTIG
jgi:beta-glucosidase/6-phospho-beta-glucosidase/beta-galactosidase